MQWSGNGSLICTPLNRFSGWKNQRRSFQWKPFLEIITLIIWDDSSQHNEKNHWIGRTCFLAQNTRSVIHSIELQIPFIRWGEAGLWVWQQIVEELYKSFGQLFSVWNSTSKNWNVFLNVNSDFFWFTHKPSLSNKSSMLCTVGYESDNYLCRRSQSSR